MDSLPPWAMMPWKLTPGVWDSSWSHPFAHSPAPSHRPQRCGCRTSKPKRGSIPVTSLWQCQGETDSSTAPSPVCTPFRTATQCPPACCGRMSVTGSLQETRDQRGVPAPTSWCSGRKGTAPSLSSEDKGGQLRAHNTLVLPGTAQGLGQQQPCTGGMAQPGCNGRAKAQAQGLLQPKLSRGTGR